MSKGLSKYIAAFDYFGMALIFLFAASDGLSITLFVRDIGSVNSKHKSEFCIFFIYRNRKETNKSNTE